MGFVATPTNITSAQAAALSQAQATTTIACTRTQSTRIQAPAISCTEAVAVGADTAGPEAAVGGAITTLPPGVLPWPRAAAQRVTHNRPAAPRTEASPSLPAGGAPAPTLLPLHQRRARWVAQEEARFGLSRQLSLRWTGKYPPTVNRRFLILRFTRGPIIVVLNPRTRST